MAEFTKDNIISSFQMSDPANINEMKPDISGWFFNQ